MWLVWVALFASFSLLTYGLLVYVGARRTVRDRVRKPVAAALREIPRRGEESRVKKRVVDFLRYLGRWAAKDQEALSEIRTTLIYAGFRRAAAPAVYFGIRSLVAVLLPIPYLLVMVSQGKVNFVTLAVSLALAGAGYYLPRYGLRWLCRRRQDRLDRALPDVLDLFIICLEGGLALPATVNRVAEEIREVCRDFYLELQLTALELRTGIPWQTALHNLGDRTGVLSVRSLVALMVQSDRLGAHIAQALRTQAEFVRTQRSLKAEEVANKLPIKMLFPLVFCVFPAIFIVILGPALISLFTKFLPGLMQNIGK